jgi:exodeoxyribonuclease VIII
MQVRSDDADIYSLLGDVIAKVGESPESIVASAKLQAMIDAARGKARELVDPRSLPVRFSRLKMFALSGAHYLDSVQDDFEETLALRMGASVHAGLFENRPVVCYDGHRRGKTWERFEKHYLEQRAVILNEPEYRLAIGVIDSVRRNARAMEILFDGTSTEERIDWMRGDRACRSTPDSYHRKGNHNSDLKSSRSTEPRWFAREALKRHYHAQLAFYDEPLEQRFGRRPDENYLVAVENVAPFNVTIMRLPDETREVGGKLVHLWFAQLLNAEQLEHYGGYVEGEVDLEIPHYENHEPVTVELDGKLVTID